MVDTTPAPTDTVCTTVDTMVDTTDTPMPPDTDTLTITARGPLMPNLRLMLIRCLLWWILRTPRILW